MGLIICTDCDGRFSDRAAQCPTCGGPNPGFSNPSSAKGVSSTSTDKPSAASLSPQHHVTGLRESFSGQPPELRNASAGGKRAKASAASLLGAIGVVSISLALVAEGTGDLAGTIGYALGVALIPTLVALLVRWRFSSNAAWTATALILCLIVLGAWSEMHYRLSGVQRRLAREETIALRDDFAAAAASAATAELGAPAAGSAGLTNDPVLAEPSVNEVARTELDVIRITRRIFNESTQRLAAKSDALAAEEARLPFDTVLAPESLVTFEGIAAGWQTLDTYTALVTRREALLKEHDAFVRSEASASIPRTQFPEFWRKFEQSSAERDATFLAFMQNQRELIAAARAVLELMKTQVGTTEAASGRILFEDVGVLNEYNTLMADIQRLANEEAVAKARFDSLNARALELINDEIRRL